MFVIYLARNNGCTAKELQPFLLLFLLQSSPCSLLPLFLPSASLYTNKGILIWGVIHLDVLDQGLKLSPWRVVFRNFKSCPWFYKFESNEQTVSSAFSQVLQSPVYDWINPLRCVNRMFRQTYFCLFRMVSFEGWNLTSLKEPV